MEGEQETRGSDVIYTLNLAGGEGAEGREEGRKKKKGRRKGRKGKG